MDGHTDGHFNLYKELAKRADSLKSAKLLDYYHNTISIQLDRRKSPCKEKNHKMSHSSLPTDNMIGFMWLLQFVI